MKFFLDVVRKLLVLYTGQGASDGDGGGGD